VGDEKLGQHIIIVGKIYPTIIEIGRLLRAKIETGEKIALLPGGELELDEECR
jgi:hypothetical protein